MKISIVINGTRGDVQPMLALAVELLKKGHDIVFCAPPENKALVEKYHCPFVAFGPDYRELFRQNSKMKGGATKSPSPAEMKRQTGEQTDLLPGLIKGSDLVLGVGFVLGVHTAADMLNIPYRFVIFYPALLGTAKTDPLIFRMLFGFGRSATNMAMKGFINKKRFAAGLDPIKDVWQHWMGDEVIVACDKELNAVPEGVLFRNIQTGYMLLPSSSHLPDPVERFLKEGEPPVYIGFGSNPVARPEKFGKIFANVAAACGQRLIISRGWAELPAVNTSDILYVDDVPFELLFPGLKAIIYHGGTGTMASAARAGIPQAAFPFMADQFANRKQIVKLGLGPETCDFKKITEARLISAIKDCTGNDLYRRNALELSQKLQHANGLEQTLDLIEKFVLP
ncbi:MAG: glycosyltransferase [Bacteroidota bacterium]